MRRVVWRGQASLMETGQLRQPLICPGWRVSQEERLALPQEHHLSTCTRGLNVPGRPGGCKASIAFFPRRTQTRSKSPQLLAEPLPGYPVCTSFTKTLGFSFSSQKFREKHSFPQMLLPLSRTFLRSAEDRARLSGSVTLWWIPVSISKSSAA